MERDKIATLWKLCFDDSDEFINLYFDAKYRPENAFVLSDDNGMPTTELLAIPYHIGYHNRNILAGYISGACTRPDMRNNGLMTRLLSETFLTLRDRHIPLIFLMPAEEWLYHYYARSGFASVLAARMEKYYLNLSPLVNSEVKVYSHQESIQNQALLFKIYDAHTRMRPFSVRHDRTDFCAIVDDLYMSNGNIFALSHSLAFAVPHKDRVFVSEIVYDTDDDKSTLLRAIASHYSLPEIECLVPPQKDFSKEIRGMIRIIDVPYMLNLYASVYPSKDFFVQVTDNQIASNNGYYRIRHGQCFRTGCGITSNIQNLSISQLAKVIFSESIFINLMME